MTGTLPRAFVSSTYEDLRDHRAYVISQLRHCGIQVDPMEDWDAAPDPPKTFSLNRIEGCSLFILLVGSRLGHIPAGESRSITQLEHDRAQGLGIDILPFMLVSSKAVDDPYEALHSPDIDNSCRLWRDEICERHGVGFFSHLPESIPVATSVARWLASYQHPLPASLSLMTLLDTGRPESDLRNYFADRLDLVKLAFADHGVGQVLPNLNVGTMKFDFVVVNSIEHMANLPPSIAYIILKSSRDTLIEGSIGRAIEDVERFLGHPKSSGDQEQTSARREMLEKALVSREDYRHRGDLPFWERAIIVGGRRDNLSKEELAIMRIGDYRRFYLVMTWDTLAERLESRIMIARRLR